MNNTRSIWKYELNVTDEQLIEIPTGAEILAVQVQHSVPCLWARVDPNATKVKRRILTHGTGHTLSAITGVYIDSYQLNGGDLVFHVFEEIA